MALQDQPSRLRVHMPLKARRSFVIFTAGGRGAHGDKHILWQLLNEEDQTLWHSGMLSNVQTNGSSDSPSWEEKAGLVQDMTGCTPGHWLGARTPVG